MFPNIEAIHLLPKEIHTFKQYIIEQSDPIKREVYNYSLVSYIVKNIVPFPVNAEYYYDNYCEDYNIEFIELLALSYIRHKLFLDNNSIGINKICFKVEDLFYSSNFIKTFFEIKLPIKDENIDEIAWIYPKKDIKIFISDSFFCKNYNSHFYDETTLIKLIMIMAGFSRYEINNLDNYPKEGLNGINYPTLILANIGLYEKEYIKIEDDINGINVFLDLSAKERKDHIFSTNKEFLKMTILKVINETEKLEYTMKDFL